MKKLSEKFSAIINNVSPANCEANWVIKRYSNSPYNDFWDLFVNEIDLPKDARLINFNLNFKFATKVFLKRRKGLKREFHDQSSND